MARDKMRHSSASQGERSTESLPVDVDEAIDDSAFAVKDGVWEFLNDLKKRLVVFGETGPLASDISDGLFVAVLRLIAPGGKYAMEKGRFWQLLDRHDPFSPSTPDETFRAHLAGELESLLAAAENENFEDGFDSVLWIELQRLVLRDGETAVAILSDLILRGRTASEVAAEALRCLGQMRNPATHEARRQLLEASLTSPSHITRDGAVIGLARLSDPRTIPHLDAAVTQETYPLLRANMTALLEQLRAMQP